MDTDKQLHGDTRFSLLFHMVLNSGCLNFSCEPLGCITAKFTARRGHREITMGAVPRQGCTSKQQDRAELRNPLSERVLSPALHWLLLVVTPGLVTLL